MTTKAESRSPATAATATSRSTPPCCWTTSRPPSARRDNRLGPERNAAPRADRGKGEWVHILPFLRSSHINKQIKSHCTDWCDFPSYHPACPWRVPILATQATQLT